MNDIALIDICCKLKVNSFKLQHAPYLDRYVPMREKKQINNLKIDEIFKKKD